MPLERFSAAWREEYVSSSDALDNSKENSVCVFCTLSKEDVSIDFGLQRAFYGEKLKGKWPFFEQILTSESEILREISSKKRKLNRLH